MEAWCKSVIPFARSTAFMSGRLNSYWPTFGLISKRLSIISVVSCSLIQFTRLTVFGYFFHHCCDSGVNYIN